MTAKPNKTNPSTDTTGDIKMTKSNWASLDNKPARKAGRKATRKVGAFDGVADTTAWNVTDTWDTFKSYGGYETYHAIGDVELSAEDQSKVDRLIHASKMVQTFVDALSGENATGYRVALDATVSTAGTDLANRVMRLPSKTILDPTLSDDEAALLAIGMLGHEIGHIRHDNDLDIQVRKDQQWLFDRPTLTLANDLSNLLREHRVEAGFEASFPGYAGLFAPMLRWISRDVKDGSTPPDNALGFALAATRYSFRYNWTNPEHAAEAAWWNAWVKDNAFKDDYPGHRAALVEALDHIKEQIENAQPKGGNPSEGGEPQDGKPSDGKPSDGKPSDGKPSNGNGGVYSQTTPGAALQAKREKANKDFTNAKHEAYDSNNADPEKWHKFNEAQTALDEFGKGFNNELNKADKEAAKTPVTVEDAGKEASNKLRGANRAEQRKQEILADQANAELGLKSGGRKPEEPTYRGDAKVGYIDPRNIKRDEEAAGTFRSMFMRLRGGADGRIGDKRHGRLNGKRLDRLASNDDRVFTARGAEKTQPLRVYVLVDSSGSMGGDPIRDAAAMATALADASVGAHNMTLEVYGWDSTCISRVFGPGLDPVNCFALQGRGGTPDGGTLQVMARKMLAEKSSEEQGVMIMLTDGQGDGANTVRSIIKGLRGKGIQVYGMAVGYGGRMFEHMMTATYGKDNWTGWQGSVSATATPLAEIIQRAWTGGSQKES